MEFNTLDDSLNKSSDENDASVGGDSALWAAFGSSESEGGDWHDDWELEHTAYYYYYLYSLFNTIVIVHFYPIFYNLPESFIILFCLIHHSIYSMFNILLFLNNNYDSDTMIV